MYLIMQCIHRRVKGEGREGEDPGKGVEGGRDGSIIQRGRPSTHPDTTLGLTVYIVYKVYIYIN